VRKEGERATGEGAKDIQTRLGGRCIVGQSTRRSRERLARDVCRSRIHTGPGGSRDRPTKQCPKFAPAPGLSTTGKKKATISRSGTIKEAQDGKQNIQHEGNRGKNTETGGKSGAGPVGGEESGITLLGDGNLKHANHRRDRHSTWGVVGRGLGTHWTRKKGRNLSSQHRVQPECKKREPGRIATFEGSGNKEPHKAEWSTLAGGKAQQSRRPPAWTCRYRYSAWPGD